MTLDNITSSGGQEKQPGIVPGPAETPDPSSAALDALKEEKTEEGENWIAKDGANDANFEYKTSNGAPTENTEGLWNKPQTEASNVANNKLTEQVADTFANTETTASDAAPETTEPIAEVATTTPTVETPVISTDSSFMAETKKEEPLPEPKTVEVPDTAPKEMVAEVETGEVELKEADSEQTPEERINGVESEWQKKMGDVLAETNSIIADLEKRTDEIIAEFEPRIAEEKQKAEDANAEIIRLENEKEKKLGATKAAQEKANSLKMAVENSEKPERLTI